MEGGGGKCMAKPCTVLHGGAIQCMAPPWPWHTHGALAMVHGTMVHLLPPWWKQVEQVFVNGTIKCMVEASAGKTIHGRSKRRQGRRKDGHSSQVKLPVPSAPQLSSKMFTRNRMRMI